MSQILLVDDEMLVIEAIQCNIDWEQCGVSKVFLCDNAYQAKQIMENHTVDLVVSDIQMPGMDGIDFAKWVKKNYPQCGIIFLTGYAEFSYAKEAITIGAEEYILKPVNYQILQEKIAHFVGRAELMQKDNLVKIYYEIHQGGLLKEWLQYILQSQDTYDGDELARLLDRFQLKLARQGRYLMFWLNLESKMDWDCSEDLKRRISDFSQSFHCVVTIAVLSEKKLFVLFQMDQERYQIDIEEIRKQVANLTGSVPVPCCCYMSELLTFEQIVPMARKLSERQNRNVMYQNRVILVGNRNIPVSRQKYDIDFKRWQMLLETNQIDKLKMQIEMEIHGIVIDGNMDAEMLRDLYNHFVQMVYYYIGEEYQVRTMIVQDQELGRLQEDALLSVEGFRTYYHYLLDRIKEYQSGEHANDVISEVKKYIENHLGEKISRAQIAEQVFLNENYLSRLFHKEVGCSISNYILEKRLAMSKSLLVQTKLSVSEIGERVGYETTTYFIRIFKQETGKTPNEFRKELTI